MSLILDAGPFLAVERADRDVVALLKREQLAGRLPITHGGIVAQVWRTGTGRQANLARLLAAAEVKPLDEELGKAAGVLLRLTGGADDAIDSALVCLARDGDEILTSDPGDLRDLAEAAGLQIDVVPV
ncbi:MAG TPA: twitching motility protein PilT [Actinomycetota bacterium]|nr:twitching motility protein PilT [Actinomycetota bacterium]